jgi:hypothetical protein
MCVCSFIDFLKYLKCNAFEITMLAMTTVTTAADNKAV